MNIQITSRHFHGSPELQTSIREDAEKLGKFNASITGIRVILDAEKNNIRKAEILIHVHDKDLCLTAEADNMHKAWEEAFLKAERQLKKENQKLKGYKSERLIEAIAE